MESVKSDIMSSYAPLIAAINNFRGPDAYVLDAIRRVSSLPPKIRSNLSISNAADVARLISYISSNRL